MIARRRKARWFRLVYVALGFLGLSLMTVIGGAVAFWLEGFRLSGLYSVNDFLLCRTFEWMLGIWSFAMGASIASFLNVVAYRVPAGLPLTGGSFCPYCRVPIAKQDNVPVLGWIFLAGRCRSCHLPISSRYPIFEAIGGFIALSVYMSTVLSHGGNLPWAHGRSTMPYGMPVNLRFFDQSIFYVASMHAIVLLLFFAAALTRWSHGVLPIKTWFTAACLIFVAYLAFPAICIEPIPNLETTSAGSFEPLVPRANVVLAASLGGFVGYLVALLTSNLLYPASSDQEEYKDQWRWIWLVLGTVMLWKATLIVFAIQQIVYPIAKRLFSYSRFKNAFHDPVTTIWFSMMLFLPCWNLLTNFLPAWVAGFLK